MCVYIFLFFRFEMECNELIEFMKVAVRQHESDKSDNMLNRVMPRDNIAIAVVLRIKEDIYSNSNFLNSNSNLNYFLDGSRLNIPQNENVTGNMLVVCTAHVHWDPEYCDVKLVQTMMLLNELNKVLEQIAQQRNISVSQIPIIISGDFNSLPDSGGNFYLFLKLNINLYLGVIEFLSKGAISKDHPDLKSFREDPCLNRLTSNEDPRYFSHNIRLESAVDPANMPYTNYT